LILSFRLFETLGDELELSVFPDKDVNSGELEVLLLNTY